MARVFIVDDHPFIRQSLQLLMAREDDLEICGMAENGEEALAGVADRHPDFVLIDVSLQDMSGIELAEALHAAHPALPLAMLSGHAGRSYVKQALDAGARGYILKGDAAGICPAIRVMLEGETFVSEKAWGAST